MAKPRILILYTGGTVGMQSSTQGYKAVDGFDELLASRLEGRNTIPLPDYDLLEYEKLIDSANIEPSDWKKIAATILEAKDKYDGFVLLHGTDTMAYTASALSYLLLGLNMPVIVTGAQIPLIELRNDAFMNVITSMILAADYDIPEVCVYFNGRLLRGNRARKLKSTGLDAFDSPNMPWLGKVGVNIELNDALFMSTKTQKFTDKEFITGSVGVLYMHPGMEGHVYESLVESPELRALILLTFGVGNPPHENMSMMGFLEKAVAKEKIIVNMSQCIEGAVHQGTYTSGDAFNQLGVVPGRDLTLEAAFTKLHFLISQEVRPVDIKHLLTAPFCGECAVSA